jgi:hypothetical protein
MTSWGGRRAALCVAGALLLTGLLAACGDDDDNGQAGSADATVTSTPSTAVDGLPAGLVAQVDHTFMPLTSVTSKVFEGEETDEGETFTLRVEEAVQPEPIVVGGIEVTVIEVHEYEDDELVERTLDYYAQGPDGVVYYIGEDVDDYEDGEVTGHSGAWLAGENGILPGIFLLVDPEVGDVFEQERAPGIAEDKSTVVALDVEITVPAGTFTGCMETEDVDPLSDSGGVEHKFYCPGVGLVREESEDGYLDLISYE